MNTPHIQKSFDQDLQSLQQRVTTMAEMVYQELQDSLNAFQSRDRDQASDSSAADTLIDASERIIDNQVISTIVLHQPMASDCRILVAALRISKDLERIGDYAKHVAEHSIILDDLPTTGEEQKVIDLGHAVMTMLQETIQAYVEGDIELAARVRKQDYEIDELYIKIFSDLLEIKTSPELTTAATHLTFLARNLERIGDHVTDIAEDIIFMKSGDFPDDSRPVPKSSTVIT